MPSAKVVPAPPRDPSQGSDEDALPAGPSGQGKTQRIAKACDRCRKSKSKCEPAPTEGEPCKSCAATGAECTYTAPSFRRGPPKGYIQALEHRLHQVESVLAAIMSSTDTRSQSIIEELSQDELASYILETVDTGPFGRTGREKRAIDTSKDNFFASIVAEQPKTLSHRSRRQSRATRENVIETVIASDPQIQTTRPTLAWQDRLSARLTRDSSVLTSQSGCSRSTFSPVGGSTDGFREEPPRTRRRMERRVDDPPSRSSVPAPSPRPPPQEPEDDLGDCAEAFGNLSIDENREVRYHGNATGLQLLALAERSDARNSKGIWRFPMAKFWPGPITTRTTDIDHAHAVEDSIRMPPIHIQDHLIRIFFTYVNPAIPVLDQESFMTQYNAQKYGYRDPEEDAHSAQRAHGDVRPEQPQKVSKLLLFSIFAYAASHVDPFESTSGEVQDHAAEYTKCARLILDTIYQESRSSTVQALILLGIREFGSGSLEEGWLHIGMATRMALDLGLNRNPDKWTHNGRELFTEKEKSIRKRIWWACCLADKFSALFLGRTIGIHEGDFSTPLLEIPPDDVENTWKPCSPHPLSGQFTPIPAMYDGYFRNVSSLYIIAGEVLAKIYRVSRSTVTPSRALRELLYKRLLQWALDLPEHLNYNVKSNRPCPAPHILAMHIQYWATVLLVHRPFIPKGSDLARAESPSLDPDHIPWESYDICTGAAQQMASFAMLYHEKYDMRWAPPFLTNCLQAAGVFNVVILRFKPLDTQASVALQKCINALAGMQRTWTTAYRVRELIQNAKVHIDNTFAAAQDTANSELSARQKRPAHVAFEQDVVYPTGSTHHGSTQQASASAIFQIPQLRSSQTFQPQTSTMRGSIVSGYMPAYESWYSLFDQPTDVGVAPAPTGAPMPMSTAAETVSLGGGLPSQEFTFSAQHFSPDFLQAMRDPVMHFPSAFAHQY